MNTINLTQNQNLILNSLINEFTKLNETEIQSSKNLLFDSSIITRRINEIKNFEQEIILNNEYWNKTRRLKIEQDALRLNESLNQLGIKAIANDSWIKLTRNNSFCCPTIEISISYELKSKYQYLHDFSKDKIIGMGILKSYLSNPYAQDEFKTIEDLCKSEAFIRSIQKLSIK
jgi:hypothetical protein